MSLCPGPTTGGWVRGRRALESAGFRTRQAAPRFEGHRTIAAAACSMLFCAIAIVTAVGCSAPPSLPAPQLTLATPPPIPHARPSLTTRSCRRLRPAAPLVASPGPGKGRGARPTAPPRHPLARRRPAGRRRAAARSRQPAPRHPPTAAASAGEEEGATRARPRRRRTAAT